MKSLATLLLIVIFIFSTTAFAGNINAEFKPIQDISHLKEGDVIEVMMRFWPVENADLSQFKKLEKTEFFNAFYLAQVESLEISANNADVVELKGVFIVKSAKPQNVFTIKYNEAPIEMHFDGIKIEDLKDKSQDYYVLDQSLNKSNILFIISGFLLILIVFAFYKRQVLKAFILSLKPDALKKLKKKYDEQFRMANKREDFELIYKEKEIWLKLLKNRVSAHNDFFKTINQYQFKKEWNNEDYNEVRSSFDVIRRSFEK